LRVAEEAIIPAPREAGMTTLQIDQKLKSQLGELSGPMEFCDEQGRRLGYFIPVEDVDASTWEWARGAFTDEELERAQNEKGGYALHEILDELTGS
jgi:hypothetical protein